MMSRFVSFFTTEKNKDKIPNVKADLGGGDIINQYFFSDAGDDSTPLPDDLLSYIESTETGLSEVVGCADPNNESITVAGEKRIYSRNAEGKIVAEVYLKGDGEIESKNENGSSKIGADGAIELINNKGEFKIKADGTIVLNGVEISPEGEITKALDVKTTTGVSLVAHPHTGNLGNPTSPPIASGG